MYIHTYFFQTITLEDVDDYLITAAIHPAQVRKKIMNLYICSLKKTEIIYF